MKALSRPDIEFFSSECMDARNVRQRWAPCRQTSSPGRWSRCRASSNRPKRQPRTLERSYPGCSRFPPPWVPSLDGGVIFCPNALVKQGTASVGAQGDLMPPEFTHTAASQTPVTTNFPCCFNTLTPMPHPFRAILEAAEHGRDDTV